MQETLFTMLKKLLLFSHAIANWLGFACLAAAAQPIIVSDTKINGVNQAGTVRVN